MKEEKKEEERSDAMPAGDVGHDIHKRAVKAYNKRNSSTKVKEDYGYSEVYAGEQLDEISKGTLGSYVNKAKKDLESRGKQQMKDYEDGEFEPDNQDAMGEYVGPKDKDSRIKTRGKGIRMAKDKLKREDYGYSDVYENRMAAYTAGESEKGGDNSAAKVTGGKRVDIKDLPKLKEPSAEAKAKARAALGLKKEELEATGAFSEAEIDMMLETLLGKN